MERVTLDDIKKIMKLLSVSLNEDRLRTVAPFLNVTMEALQPLTKMHLPKELEPGSYLARLREVGRTIPSEDT